jgi:hypothetical protein
VLSWQSLATISDDMPPFHGPNPMNLPSMKTSRTGGQALFADWPLLPKCDNFRMSRDPGTTAKFALYQGDYGRLFRDDSMP